MKWLIFGSGLMLLMAFTPWDQGDIIVIAKAAMFLVGLGIAVNGLMMKD